MRNILTLSRKSTALLNIEQRELVKKHLGWGGAMISASKGDYLNRYPKHIVVFNSNIVTEDGEKIWFGDIDITLDEQKLVDLSNELNKSIYVLKEMDGRFENEKTPKLDRFVFKAIPNGPIDTGKSLYHPVHRISKGKSKGQLQLNIPKEEV